MHRQYPAEPLSSEHPGRQKLAIGPGDPRGVARARRPRPRRLPSRAAPGGVCCSAWPSSAPRSCWRGAPKAIQLDISAGLALALLALIAVLPEYAVDFVFTWKAGKDPVKYAPDALANMTGGNQLLIGVGWSMVVLVARLPRPSRPPRQGPATAAAERRPDHHRGRARTLALGGDRVLGDRHDLRAHAAVATER